MFTNVQSCTFILFEQLDKILDLIFHFIITRLLDNVRLKIILYILSRNSQNTTNVLAHSHITHYTHVTLT